MALTDTEIRKAKAKSKTYRMSDGGGLYLFLPPSGGKLWRWKYRFEGREKLMSFGSYPDTSLSVARDPVAASASFQSTHSIAVEYSFLSPTTIQRQRRSFRRSCCSQGTTLSKTPRSWSRYASERFVGNTEARRGFMIRLNSAKARLHGRSKAPAPCPLRVRASAQVVPESRSKRLGQQHRSN